MQKINRKAIQFQVKLSLNNMHKINYDFLRVSREMIIFVKNVGIIKALLRFDDKNMSFF